MIRFLLPPSLGAVRTTARARLLGAVLSRWLGEQAEVEIAEGYNSIVQRVVTAKVELAWAPPLVCAEIGERARVFYKSVRDGRSTYRAALVVKDPGIVAIEDLLGKRAAWVDRLSAAGYVLPMLFLRRQGVDPRTAFVEQQFAGSFEAALTAVAKGEADVTSVYASDTRRPPVQETLVELARQHARDLRPFAFTEEAPTDGLLITRALPRERVTWLCDLIENNPPRMLLEALNVHAFEKCEASVYARLRQGLVDLGR